MTVLGQHPTRLDLYIHPGDPIDFTVPVLDAGGDAQSLTGWTVAAAATAPDEQLLHTFTTTVPTPASGVIEVSATGVETAAWSWSVYAARLVVTATPPTGAAGEITAGWIRLYRP